jgi:hypothetical protein
MSDTTETETETNTDNTDEPSKAELHDRVQQLESTVAKMMPSRRDALRMGAAGIAGAAGLGAASQSADASTGSAGAIGSSSDRPDLFADEIDANRAKVITESQSGNEGTVSFSGLQTDKTNVVRLFLRVTSITITNGDLKLQVNGETSSSYETVFTDGSSTVDDGFIIHSSTDQSANAVGELTISTAPFTRIGITGPVAAGQHGRISRTLQSGGIDQNIGPVDSLSFVSTQSGTSNYDIRKAAVAIYQY